MTIGDIASAYADARRASFADATRPLSYLDRIRLAVALYVVRLGRGFGNVAIALYNLAHRMSPK